MKTLKIDTEFITLGQFLKAADVISTGGMAKWFLSENEILINGEQDQRRGRKLRSGDKIEIPGSRYIYPDLGYQFSFKGMKRMFIKQLHLKNYRNYEQLEVQFENKVNVILGENAQGKTNVMESIYVLAMAKSHRTQMIKILFAGIQNMLK